ncbi:hypothetical protein AFIC_001017 [[Pseudomonas] carboxydohydrogena]|uniref:Uncharacterized protein n=1 Tax=Afipia carboxydohydrogena TaxID=290 RepID=A0ABY8BSE5_AFICR|nr:hypothetical protein [[Pseudomonas] carboxydohydrogena]WEF52526.1 hypothetical protein AFIC_001017 [[Pseudomonas] carboxydohydrogena]
MTAPGRIACCVPFCRRTCRNDGGFAEWICGKHWAAVSKTTKRRRRLADRAKARAFRRSDQQYLEQGGLTESQLNRALAAGELSRALWRRCKREATERAMGI